LDVPLKEHFFFLDCKDTTFALFLQPLFLSFLCPNDPFFPDSYPISAPFLLSKPFHNILFGYCYFLTPEICLKKNDKHKPNISLRPLKQLNTNPPVSAIPTLFPVRRGPLLLQQLIRKAFQAI